MADRSREMYLSEYAQISPCTPEENRTLMESKFAGSDAALTRLVEGNMFRVNEAAAALSGGKDFFMDLVQEGSMALFVLLQETGTYTEGFEDTMDSAVLKAMQDYLASEEESGKAGQELSDRLNLIDQACVMLAEKLGREATAEEVAEAVEMDASDVRYLMQIALSAIKKE